MQKKISFEENLKRLDEIVRLLEQNEVSLDDSIKLFEEGMTLSKVCSDVLKDSEQQIVKIMEEGQMKDFRDGQL